MARRFTVECAAAGGCGTFGSEPCARFVSICFGVWTKIPFRSLQREKIPIGPALHPRVLERLEHRGKGVQIARCSYERLQCGQAISLELGAYPASLVRNEQAMSYPYQVFTRRACGSASPRLSPRQGHFR